LAVLCTPARHSIFPAEFHLDMQNLPVRDGTDNSDEKIALSRLEGALKSGSQAPLFQLRWMRVVPNQNPQSRVLTYSRDAMRLNYKIENQTELECGVVGNAEIYGMAHGVNNSIAGDMATLAARKARPTP
jgi:hypothetical protein